MAEPDPERRTDGDDDVLDDRMDADERADVTSEDRADLVDDRDRESAVVADDRPEQPRTVTAVVPPAEPDAPVAPKREGNRLVGTAWVLLASGIFQVVYFGLLALLVVLLAGPGVVPTQLNVYFGTPLAWLPVLFFFLLFELTVLIFNRAGRFLYVVASLVVGVLVYAATVVLTTILLRGGVGDTATLQQALLVPQFVLAGFAAREVMLWTGVAIGARGSRVRRRNRAARDAYRAELAEG